MKKKKVVPAKSGSQFLEHSDAAFLEWHNATEGQTRIGLDIKDGKDARKQGWDAAIEYATKRLLPTK